MENDKLIEEIVTHAKEWKVTIIPGNLNFGLEGKRGIFHQLLPLSPNGQE